jgi:SpoVK/Ycf46/Vps4 family AAA+-type ATPase
MARSDLLIALVKAGSSGDRESFRKVVEMLVAEERGKKHGMLAERLEEAIEMPNGSVMPLRTVSRNGAPSDLFIETIPSKTFEDMVLPRPVLDLCRELVEEQHRTELLRSHGMEPRNRVLLAGAPGNGKTSLAEALAQSLMVPLISARYDGLIASYLGETASRLRKLFDYVHMRRCVLFFDEFDTVGKERGDEHETGEIKRVVSSLLMQVDDLPSHVVVVAATNHPELLDRAVWRRFQMRLELPAPTKEQREAYFERVSRRFDFPLGFAARTLAERLNGASFSELEDFVTDVERLKQWKARFSP